MGTQENEIKNIPGYEWIVQDPELLGGQPTIKNTRLSVAFVLDCLADGMTAEEIEHDYGNFPVSCVPEVLKYAAEHIRKNTKSNVAA